jgi:hypothetical protein
MNIYTELSEISEKNEGSLKFHLEIRRDNRRKREQEKEKERGTGGKKERGRRWRDGTEKECMFERVMKSE